MCTSATELIHIDLDIQWGTPGFAWLVSFKLGLEFFHCDMSLIFFTISFEFFFSVLSINFQLLFKSCSVECGLFIVKILMDSYGQNGQLQFFKLIKNIKGNTRTV